MQTNIKKIMANKRPLGSLLRQMEASRRPNLEAQGPRGGPAASDRDPDAALAPAPGPSLIGCAYSLLRRAGGPGVGGKPLEGRHRQPPAAAARFTRFATRAAASLADYDLGAKIRI